jgi:hypothetical protein
MVPHKWSWELATVPPRRRQRRTYGRLLLEKIKPDSLIAFTDGASKGNPAL